jgi:hypothetical protein
VKLISKFSDYYDSALAYGIDNTVIYKRVREEIVFARMRRHWETNVCIVYNKFSANLKSIIADRSKSYQYELKSSKDKSINITVEANFLLFCSKLYPYFEIDIKGTDHNCIRYNISEFSYSEEDLIKVLSKYATKEDISKFLEKDTRFFSSTKRSSYFKEIFKKYENIDYVHLHHELNCPFALIHSDKIIKNPVLKDIKFVKHLDPLATYQSIEQFISGVMGGQSPVMIEIDDIYRIQAHGFDKKMSFRKRKEN